MCILNRTNGFYISNYILFYQKAQAFYLVFEIFFLLFFYFVSFYFFHSLIRPQL